MWAVDSSTIAKSRTLLGALATRGDVIGGTVADQDTRMLVES